MPPYLKWLRGRDCCIGGQCSGRTEACHVDYAGGKGMGIKVADQFCVPMCGAHHGESHMAGVKTFEARHKVNLLAQAERFWSHWLHHTPMGKAWKDKQDG